MRLPYICISKYLVNTVGLNIFKLWSADPSMYGGLPGGPRAAKTLNSWSSLQGGLAERNPALYRPKMRLGTARPGSAGLGRDGPRRILGSVPSVTAQTGQMTRSA